jgi:hypothetical protein
MAMKKTSGGDSPFRQGAGILDPPHLGSMTAADGDVFLEN